MRASHLALVVACGAVLLMDARCDGRREGALSQQIADGEARVALREQAIAILAAQRDTVKVEVEVKVAAAFDSAAAYERLRDSILASLPVPDSGTVVPTLIQSADAALRSCHGALRTLRTSDSLCTVLLAQKDSVIGEKDRLLGLERQRSRGCRVLGFLPCPKPSAGVNVDANGVRPGLHIGIPLP